jgi:putative ABC transport system ATP-binding protein
MIKTEGVSFQYSGSRQLGFPDIEVGVGERLLLMGQSGSGKTTFLHLIAGLLTPQRGRILVNQTSIHELKGYRRDHFRGRQIGIVFQQPRLLGPLQVWDNIQLATYLAKSRSSLPISDLLTELGIAHLAKAPSQAISQGEAQRVALARALVNRPAVLLADEPTSALDDDHAKKVSEMLIEVSQIYNTTLLVVTHDQRMKAYFEEVINF